MNRKSMFAFALLTSLFFFWGFIHNLDPILIPHLRNAFNLSHLQSSFVDSSVYIAYFVMAIPAGIFIQKTNYKTGTILRLLLFSFGCFLFVPAANTISYPFFLIALFVVACGLATLETAANPYVTTLGDPATGAQRLNFAQSFNGLAAFISPILGGKLILTNNPISHEDLQNLPEQARDMYLHAETSTVKLHYVVLGSIILALAIIFFFAKLPENKSTSDNEENKKNAFFSLKIKNVKSAVIAQFFYIGAQVCIFSFTVVLATEVLKMDNLSGAKYAGFAGLAFLIGRFFGTFLMRYISAARLLSIFSILALLLTSYIIVGNGVSILYALIGVAFFMSIMYPTIFALGIQNAREETKSVASLLVMSIVGGAILPPILGFVSDKMHDFQKGYIVPAICFLVVFLFAWKNRKITSSDNNKIIGGH